jgi:hypothetical protein
VSLADWQWQVGDLVLGQGTPYFVSEFDHAKPDAATGDQALPGRDGVAFGRDFLPGMNITMEGQVVAAGDPGQALTLLAAWRTAWQADGVRTQPGAVSTLSYRLPGREGVVFGRPRRFAPALGPSMYGVIPVTCDWQCADHRWYGADEQAIVLGTMPDTSGGITWPITWDITWAGESSAGDRVLNTGDCDTYPVITFRGPIATPSVSWGGRTLALGLTLTSTQAVVVDCRPWVQTAVYESGGSVAGLLRGDRLADMALAPGLTEVQFRGIDLTGTASCEIRWRSASTSP